MSAQDGELLRALQVAEGRSQPTRYDGPAWEDEPTSSDGWQPGDPLYPFEPDYDACSACGTVWSKNGDGPRTCPECGAPAIDA